MTTKDLHKARTTIYSLAKEWGQTPEETRQTIVQSFETMMNDASPVDRLRYLSMVKTPTPTAEEIILQVAKEIVPAQFRAPQPDPLQTVTQAWAIFQKIAQEENTTPEAVRKSIAETIDAAHTSADPKTSAYWNHLFPHGKPTPEAFIIRMSVEARNRY